MSKEPTKLGSANRRARREIDDPLWVTIYIIGWPKPLSLSLRLLLYRISRQRLPTVRANTNNESHARNHFQRATKSILFFSILSRAATEAEAGAKAAAAAARGFCLFLLTVQPLGIIFERALEFVFQALCWRIIQIRSKDHSISLGEFRICARVLCKRHKTAEKWDTLIRTTYLNGYVAELLNGPLTRPGSPPGLPSST